MKNLFKAKKVFALTGSLVMLALVAMSLAHPRFQAHAASSPGEPGDIKGITGMFFQNPADSGVFDVAPSTTPVFTKKFPVIYFNPTASMQNCTNPTGVDENARPMMVVSPQKDGSCKVTVVGSKQKQAGVGSLTSFEAVFTAFVTVTKPRQETFTVNADDGWIFSLGPNSTGAQPTYVSGPMVNAPTSAPFTGYTVMGANNQAESPIASYVTVNFPAPGNYPIELDYTECCGGALTLTLVPNL